MVAFVVIVLNVVFDGFSQGFFTEKNEVIEAFGLHGFNEALGVAVLLGCANSGLDDLHSGAFERLAKCLGIERVVVADKVFHAIKNPVLSIG